MVESMGIRKCQFTCKRTYDRKKKKAYRGIFFALLYVFILQCFHTIIVFLKGRRKSTPYCRQMMVRMSDFIFLTIDDFDCVDFQFNSLFLMKLCVHARFIINKFPEVKQRGRKKNSSLFIRVLFT